MIGGGRLFSELAETLLVFQTEYVCILYRGPVKIGGLGQHFGNSRLKHFHSFGLNIEASSTNQVAGI
jgi:hypothetical protein